jgi:hypothetical protein
MSVEIHDKLIAILTEVDELKGKESGLKAEKLRHQELIAQSEGEMARCNTEIDDIRENQLRLRREMDNLKNELFKREEDEEVIEIDNSHVVTDGSAPSTESERHHAWKDRQRQLRSVT